MSESKVDEGLSALKVSDTTTTASAPSSTNSPANLPQPLSSAAGATVTASSSQESFIPEAQRWYRDPQWLYLRPQLQHMLDIGRFGYLVWKRKLSPDLRWYLLPVRLETIMPKRPRSTSADPVTEEEIENLDFLAAFARAYSLESKRLADLARKRYEQYHGHPCPPRPTQGL